MNEIRQLATGTEFWINEDERDYHFGYVIDNTHALVQVDTPVQLWNRFDYDYSNKEMVTRAGSSVYWDSYLYEKTINRENMADVLPNKVFLRHLVPQTFWCTTPPGLIKKLGKGKEVKAYAQLPALGHLHQEADHSEGEYYPDLVNAIRGNRQILTRTPASDHSLYVAGQYWQKNRPTRWPKQTSTSWVIVEHDGKIKMTDIPKTKGYYGRAKYIALSSSVFDYPSNFSELFKRSAS